jgi:glycosyltransferase involved in cell wall biosynthesis
MVTTVPSTLRGFLLPFAEAFAARGWRVDAAADGVSSCAECVGAFDRVWDVRWSRNPLAPGNLLRAPRTLRDLVAREGYDLVHVHTPVAGFVARFALRELRRRQVRVIYTAHGFHFYRGGRRLRNAAFLALERLAGRWTDHLVVINREDEEAARRHRIVPPDRVCYMPGIGVDPGRYDPARVDAGEVARVRAELRVPPGGPLFTLVGEFIPRKRHRDALRAFARLAHPEARLALAGDGPLLGPMKELAARLGLGERVHFLAFRRDVPALVRSSSAVLLVSEQEGLPRSVLEALSLEVPVIGTDIRGTRELLAGGAGLRVPVGDVAGLAAALDWVARHPDEARQMGRAGRLLVQREFSHEVVLRLHEDLYARALGEG